MREPAVVSTPFVEMTSLSAIGTPDPSPFAVDGAQEAVELAVALVDGGAVRVTELARRDLVPLEKAVRLLGGQPEGVDHSRHGGTLKSPFSSVGRVRQDIVERQRLVGHVLVPDVHEIERVRGRRHVREVELGDDADRVEDLVELAGEALDLLLGQRQPREPATCSTSSREMAIRSDPLKETGPQLGARPLRRCRVS